MDITPENWLPTDPIEILETAAWSGDIVALEKLMSEAERQNNWQLARSIIRQTMDSSPFWIEVKTIQMSGEALDFIHQTPPEERERVLDEWKESRGFHEKLKMDDRMQLLTRLSAVRDRAWLLAWRVKRGTCQACGWSSDSPGRKLTLVRDYPGNIYCHLCDEKGLGIWGGPRRNPEDTLEDMLSGKTLRQFSVELPELIQRKREVIEDYDIDFSRILGCGGWGCIFPLKNSTHLVAKFTTDKSEIALFEHLRHWSPYPKGIVATEDIIFLGRPTDTPYWLIIREAAIPLRQLEVSQQQYEEILMAVQTAIYDYDSEDLVTTRILSEYGWNLRPLINTLSEFDAQGIDYEDISSGNIGLLENRFVIYDAQMYLS